MCDVGLNTARTLPRAIRGRYGNEWQQPSGGNAAVMLNAWRVLESARSAADQYQYYYRV